MLKVDGKPICFLLAREYLNYHYHEPKNGIDSALFRAKIKDCYCGRNGITAIWADTMVLGRPGNEWIILIESEYDETAHGIVTHYKIANVFDDRLPQHPFIFVGDWMNGKTGNPIKDNLIRKILESGE